MADLRAADVPHCPPGKRLDESLLGELGRRVAVCLPAALMRRDPPPIGAVVQVSPGDALICVSSIEAWRARVPRPAVKPVSRCQRPPAKATGIRENRPRTVGHRYIPMPHFRSRISITRTNPRHSAHPRSKGSSHLHLSRQVTTNPTGHGWWLELRVQRLGRCCHRGR